jgi:predicted transcriptional regulator
VTHTAPASKRQFLVHLDADLIRRIKILAINRKVTASSLVQAALLDYLAAQETTRSRKEEPEC